MGTYSLVQEVRLLNVEHLDNLVMGTFSEHTILALVQTHRADWKFMTCLCGDVVSNRNLGPEEKHIRLFQPGDGDDAH